MDSAWDNDRAILRGYRERSLTRVRAGEFAGRWHPTGFAVFHLDELEDGRKLRLHVWPRGYRPTLPQHPPIHSHNWHLASLVLVGTYTDVMYENDVDSGKQYFLHQYAYFPDGDSVQPKGEVKLRESEHRTIEKGDYHVIPAGDLHETRIPLSQPVCTLVLMGTPMNAQMVLAGPTKFEVNHYVRPDLTQSERRRVSEVILAAEGGGS